METVKATMVVDRSAIMRSDRGAIHDHDLRGRRHDVGNANSVIMFWGLTEVNQIWALIKANNPQFERSIYQARLTAGQLSETRQIVERNSNKHEQRCDKNAGLHVSALEWLDRYAAVVGDPSRRPKPNEAAQVRDLSC